MKTGEGIDGEGVEGCVGVFVGEFELCRDVHRSGT